MRAWVPSHQFDRYVPYRVNTSSHKLGWRGFRVEVVRGHSPGEISLPPLDHHLLNMIVSTRTQHAHRWDGHSAESVGDTGALALVPAGCESYWRWTYMSAEPPCDFHIHLDPMFVRRVAIGSLNDLPPAFDLRGELCFEQAEVAVLSMALLRELEAGGPNGSLYAESLATAMAALLVTRQQGGTLRTDSGRGLPVRQVREVCDYIDGHLGDDLHLETLGTVAGMGPERLRRAFRALMGESPFRFVLRRRLDRARDQLRTTALPITDLALALGFSDHSHFTSVFRRETGRTPSEYRTGG